MARFLLFVVAICLAPPMNIVSLTAQEEASEPSLALKLEAEHGAIRPGTKLLLRLTIENVSQANEKILQPRGTLQDTYYALVVTKDGKPLELERAISDPGPIPDEAFVILKPGKKISFEFLRYAVAVHALPPGKYQAQIRFWQDPYQAHTTAVMSPAITFVVVK